MKKRSNKSLVSTQLYKGLLEWLFNAKCRVKRMSTLVPHLIKTLNLETDLEIKYVCLYKKI